MANTYTQIHIHFVFAVKYRDAVIKTEWKDELYKYISGIIKNNNHKLICINGMPDHILFLAGMNPAQSISDFMREIKCNSSKWINEKKFVQSKFEWQEGYGAFSYSKSYIHNVISYINNQEEHHKKRTFREEYIEFMKRFQIEYDEKYIFNETQ